MSVHILLNYEIHFTNIQVAKILNHYNTTIIELFNKKIFQQKTSVASYFIVKSMYMHNIYLIYEYINKNIFLNYNIFTYLDILEKTFTDDHYINKIIFYQNHIKKWNSNEFIKNMLRMSCVELSVYL